MIIHVIDRKTLSWPNKIRASSKPHAFTMYWRVKSRMAVMIMAKDVKDHIMALIAATGNKSGSKFLYMLLFPSLNSK